MKNVLKKIAMAATIAGAAVAANATPVVGIANLSFGLVSVSLGEIDWNPPSNPGYNANATYGQFFTQQGANTGSFAGAAFAGITQGLVQDMSQNPTDGNFVNVGANPSGIASFLSFGAQPGWLFTAYELIPGTLGSPYLLAQNGPNVSATIVLNGLVCDSGGDMSCDSGDDITKWTGIFSAQFTNITVQSLINTIVGGGTLQNNTWSATIEASRLPEPGSIALLGLGLIGLAATRRRAAK